MGSTGVCWDNAVAETFFATLKKELVYRRSWPTRHELISEIFEFVEAFYNRQRRHSTLGMLSPVEFEEVLAARPFQTLADNIKSTTNYTLTAKALNCPDNRGNSTRQNGSVSRTGLHGGWG